MRAPSAWRDRDLEKQSNKAVNINHFKCFVFRLLRETPGINILLTALWTTQPSAPSPAGLRPSVRPWTAFLLLSW